MRWKVIGSRLKIQGRASLWSQCMLTIGDWWRGCQLQASGNFELILNNLNNIFIFKCAGRACAVYFPFFLFHFFSVFMISPLREFVSLHVFHGFTYAPALQAQHNQDILEPRPGERGSSPVGLAERNMTQSTVLNTGDIAGVRDGV